MEEAQETLAGEDRLVCPGCGESFENITLHYRLSSTCSHPEYSETQRGLAIGLVMGDGSVEAPQHEGGDSGMVVHSTSERFLRWIHAQFGVFAIEPRLLETGEEIGERARKYEDFDDSGGEWEYRDIYYIRLRSHPFLTQLRERWYADGDIRYPDDLSLTPTIAKMWYCSDGGLSWSDRKRVHAAFGTHNESDRPEFLCGLFEEHGFSPNWSEPLVRFTHGETPKLLSWMGVAPAGFEYKWEYESRDRYDHIKAVATGEIQ